MSGTEKKYCHCKPTCGKLLTEQTRKRHYRAVPADSIRPSVSPIPSLPSEGSDDELPNPPPLAVPPPSASEPHADSPPRDFEMTSHLDGIESDAMEVDSDSGTSDSETASSSGTEEPHSTAFNPEVDPWSGFDEFQDLDKPVSREEMMQMLDELLGPGDEPAGNMLDDLADRMRNDREYDSDEEARSWDSRNSILTEQDRDDIRAFQLKLMSKMPRTAYNQMVYAFSHKLSLSSEWVMFHRMAILSGVEPLWFDCCVDSCIAYTDAYSELTECPFCDKSRYSPTGKPRRMFCYLPIVPRLQGLFQNLKSIERLLYRANYIHHPGKISDVFDGQHYRSLCQQNVVLDGNVLEHKYFSGMYDVCLGICLDSYLLFKRNRSGPSATPILVKNFNIKPEVRTHLDPFDGGLMSAGVIPGPHPPKDVHSFLVPYDAECAALAVGVRTFNAATRHFFLLRGYTLFELGDIIAIEKSLNIKGHNSGYPCRSCEIKGIRNKAGREKLYYVPLTWPNGQFWDPESLPLRSQERLDQALRKFDEISTVLDENAAAKAKDDLAKSHGMKGHPALRRVGCLAYPKSRPWDVMHLFFENVIPNLVKLWSGKFKGLDTGSEDYEIAEETWDVIWAETAAAVRHIPADFVRVLGTTPGYYTAEAWAFWFIYLAPILLKGRFSNRKYYTHLCELSDIIQGCLRFTSTEDQVNDLRQAIIAWIHKYEEYYYQHLESRLRVCTLTIHGMVHVPDDILFCGPSWTTWTFFMERFCGVLQAGLRSKRLPWANLNNNVLRVAYLEQLNARYDLETELSSASKMQRAAARTREYTYEGYPQAILVPPYQRHHIPTEIIREKIADHFGGLLGQRPHRVLPFIPEKIPSFGKLRIVQGDSVRSASACGDGATAERDMSFIRYEIESRPTTTAAWAARISYGRLERVLECTLPLAKELQHLSGKTRLLAVISPCLNTQGKDAALVRTSYRDIGDPIVTDLQAVAAVVGRVETRDRWYIVDRTGGLIRPEFVSEDEDVDDN